MLDFLIGLAVIGVVIFLFVKFKILRIIAIVAIVAYVCSYLFAIYQEKLEKKVENEGRQMAKNHQKAYSFSDFENKYKIIHYKKVVYKSSYLNSYTGAVKNEIRERGKQMAENNQKAYGFSDFESEFEFSKIDFSGIIYVDKENKDLYDFKHKNPYKDFYLESYIGELFRQTAMFTLDEFVYLNQFYLTDISTDIFDLPTKLEMLNKNSVIYDGQETTNPFSADDWCQEDNFTVKLSGDIFDDYKKLIIPYLDNSSDIEKIELDNDLVYKSKCAKSDNLITVEISLD